MDAHGDAFNPWRVVINTNPVGPRNDILAPSLQTLPQGSADSGSNHILIATDVAVALISQASGRDTTQL